MTIVEAEILIFNFEIGSSRYSGFFTVSSQIKLPFGRYILLEPISKLEKHPIIWAVNTIRHTGACRYPVKKIIYWMPEPVRHDDMIRNVKTFLKSRSVLLDAGIHRHDV
jgi:hypothetical protein